MQEGSLNLGLFLGGRPQRPFQSKIYSFSLKHRIEHRSRFLYVQLMNFELAILDNIFATGD